MPEWLSAMPIKNEWEGRDGDGDGRLAVQRWCMGRKLDSGRSNQIQQAKEQEQKARRIVMMGKCDSDLNRLPRKVRW